MNKVIVNPFGLRNHELSISSCGSFLTLNKIVKQLDLKGDEWDECHLIGYYSSVKEARTDIRKRIKRQIAEKKQREQNLIDWTKLEEESNE